ncbi:hypothetical protein Vafri_16882 [Volvox africanus]|uniref:Pherophorin domain-containing protein n=1 Tax=Volvox africanus TaxID=51714 RepID=A0A8J4BJP3_9CHLO|nr:hypothetical protein Vafri_16882 [Volvox africanus]
MFAGRSYVLGILLLATFSLSVSCSCMPNGICSGYDLVVALQNDDVSSAQLWVDIRLASSDWPATPIIRKKHFTLKGGGAARVLLDFADVVARLTLAPGVILTLQDLEYRSASTGVGFGLPLLTPSPGARVELRNVAVFAFVCLPFEFLMSFIRGYSAHMPLEYALDAQQRISVASSWCRTTPAIARCYNNTIALMRVVLPLDAGTGSETDYGDSGNGGAAFNVTKGISTTSTMYGSSYALVSYNSTLICQEPLSPYGSCNWNEGYSACLTSRWKELSAQDDIWALLEASAVAGPAAPVYDSAGSNSSGGGRGGGEETSSRRRLSTTQLAFIIFGAILGALLLILLLLLLLVRSFKGRVGYWLRQQQPKHVQFCELPLEHQEATQQQSQQQQQTPEPWLQSLPPPPPLLQRQLSPPLPLHRHVTDNTVFKRNNHGSNLEGAVQNGGGRCVGSAGSSSGAGAGAGGAAACVVGEGGGGGGDPRSSSYGGVCGGGGGGGGGGAVGLMSGSIGSGGGSSSWPSCGEGQQPIHGPYTGMCMQMALPPSARWTATAIASGPKLQHPVAELAAEEESNPLDEFRKF